MKKRPFKLKKSGGYAIIFSVVVVSVIVIVALAVSSLVQKELELSSIGQQSMEAFFAADAGIECALVADIKNRNSNIFPRPAGGGPLSNPSTVVRCDNRNRPVTLSGSNSYVFSLNRTDDKFCATVTVEIIGTSTKIKSRGFNNCDSSDPNRVERGLEVRY